jgi:hypothetical protein
MPDTPVIVGFVGFCEKVLERIHGGEREEGDGALEALKAWCEVRTPGPSDVAGDRMRPCRDRWDHDLYG